jgi:hypothetical protein
MKITMYSRTNSRTTNRATPNSRTETNTTAEQHPTAGGADASRAPTAGGGISRATAGTTATIIIIYK